MCTVCNINLGPKVWKWLNTSDKVKVVKRSLWEKHIFIFLLFSCVHCWGVLTIGASTEALIAQQLSQREAGYSDASTVSLNRCSISNLTRSPSVSGSKSWLSVRKGCGHCVPYEIHALLLVEIGWVVSVVTWCLTGTAPHFCQLAVRKLRTLKLC